MLDRSRSNSEPVMSLADDIPQTASDSLEIFLPNIWFYVSALVVRHPNREVRSPMCIEFRVTGRPLHHRGVNMRRLQPPTFNLTQIGGVDTIDKIAIPFSIRIEVGSINAVQENINDIAKAEKEIKMKALQQQEMYWVRIPSNPTPEYQVPASATSRMKCTWDVRFEGEGNSHAKVGTNN